MGRRADLHHILEATLGSKNVYFEPPESFKLTYPCIVYFLDAHHEALADNDQYSLSKRYAMTYLTFSPDDVMVDKLERLRFCHLSRHYTASNLHHYAYTIFY